MEVWNTGSIDHWSISDHFNGSLYLYMPSLELTRKKETMKNNQFIQITRKFSLISLKLSFTISFDFMVWHPHVIIFLIQFK